MFVGREGGRGHFCAVGGVEVDLELAEHFVDEALSEVDLDEATFRSFFDEAWGPWFRV